MGLEPNTFHKDSTSWGSQRENPGQNKEQPLYNLLQEKKSKIIYIYVYV